MSTTVVRRSTGIRRAVTALVICGAAVLPAACASPDDPVSTENPAGASVNNNVNPRTLTDTADAVARLGLPVTNQHDVTAQMCPTAGCASALVADQFTLMQFRTTGQAEIYLGDHVDAFQILNLVVDFPTGTPADQQTRYQKAIQTSLS